MNWMFVNFYWTMLANVGQVTPVNYKPGPPTPLIRLMKVNFSDIQTYDSKYNTLLNSDLYDRQTKYLTNTLLPLLNRTTPKIQSLNDTQPFSPGIATFVRSYSCNIRQWKDPFGLIFSVVTTIWVFTTGPISVILLIATWFETRDSPFG